MCKHCDKPISYAETMRLIDSRFGTVNAPIAKRNLERMMEWYQREGKYSLPKKGDQPNQRECLRAFPNS